MSCKSLLTLQDLAENSLLRNQTLMVSSLDYVPSFFFPSLFKKACIKCYNSIVMAMVQVWPFPCLPLGAMVRRKAAYRSILKVILLGLDALLSQKIPHRKSMLKVLDLRVMPLEMWKKWSTFRDSDWCKDSAVVDHLETEVKPLVKVVVDLVLSEGPLDSTQSFIIQWVNRREGLSLCCDKLQIRSCGIQYHREVLDILDLDSVQRLSLYNISFSCLRNFSPYLGRMRCLHSLLLSCLWPGLFLTPVEKQQVITQFTSQLVKLECLQSLYLYDVILLEGHLDELFWWLKRPLETLVVTHCSLSKSDWISMCEFLCTSEIKHLIIKWVKLTHFSPDPLRVLLLKSAPTLMTLKLVGCQLTDCQLNAILPALRLCTHLTQFSVSESCLPVFLEQADINHKIRPIKCRRYSLSQVVILQ